MTLNALRQTAEAMVKPGQGILKNSVLRPKALPGNPRLGASASPT